jgi:ribonuclease HI
MSTVSAQELREVEIIIDGSCLGNPGPGGWACILQCGEHERVLQGGVPDATNNRMELAAAIEGLRALKRACQVTVLTDSEYVRRGITEFLPRWRSNGWRNASGKAVVNQDLWEQLEELAGYHAVTWVHVRGHSGQPDHERCDALAISAARAARCNRDCLRAKVTEIANLRLRPWIQARRCRGQRNRLNGSLPDAAGRKEMFRIVTH